jgi:hypothetical protein
MVSPGVLVGMQCQGNIRVEQCGAQVCVLRWRITFQERGTVCKLATVVGLPGQHMSKS